MAGLFSTFNVALRGMAVQQKALDVTSHNIANANTEGFSRQRVNIETTRPFTDLSMSIGTGAQVSEITRVRDSFVDYQVRTETSTLGTYTVRDSVLSQVESIFNEPSDTGISSLLGKFFDAFQELSKQPQGSNARTVAAEQSSALADGLNQTYNQLISLKENTKDSVKSSIIDINSTLTQVNDLNKQIVNASITGDSPNDLMDKRDLLLDSLSSKFNIIVEKDGFNGINLRPSDGLDINNTKIINSKNPNDMKSLSYIDSIKKVSDGKYTITYYRFGDMTNSENRQEITVDGVSDVQYNLMNETRVLISDSQGYAINNSNESKSLEDGVEYKAEDIALFNPKSGELKGNISSESDVDNYINEINKLAKTLTFAVNSIHSGMADGQAPNVGDSDITSPLLPPVKDFMPFFVNSSAAKYTASDKMENLDSILASESEINAGNISVNKQIISDVMNIKTRTNDDNYDYEKDNDADGDKDGARALAIGKLRDSLIKIQDMGSNINSRAELFDPAKGGTVFTDDTHMNIVNNTDGITLGSYFKDIIDKLGIQEQQAQRMVKNQDSLLASLKESKESISGVSTDEEVANLVRFQHAYQANAKVISVIDDLLNTIINGLIK